MKKYKIFTSNAGHSPKSPGASGFGFKEHEQARLCNKAFIEQMNKRGHAVTDTTSEARNKAAVLQEQVAKANKIKKTAEALHLSYHMNSANGSATGTEVLHYGSETREVAAKVSAAIAKALGVRDRGAKERKDLYFLKKTIGHAILVETCFISNEEDMAKFSERYEKAMEAVANVLVGPSKQTEKTPDSKAAYSGNSVVDYLKSEEADSSFENRARLAVEHGIVDSRDKYKGTAIQNSILLKALRESR